MIGAFLFFIVGWIGGLFLFLALPIPNHLIVVAWCAVLCFLGWYADPPGHKVDET